MFQVTTMDMNNVPTDDNGAVDYSQDFFGKETNLTVSGQLNCRDICTGIPQCLYIWTNLPRREFQHNHDMRQSSG